MDNTNAALAGIRGALRAATIVAALGLAAGPAVGQAGIDPDADQVLHAMTSYLGGLPAFSVNADVDVEYIDMAGQKLQLDSSGSLLLVRPGSYYAQRRGPFGSFELFIDGKNATLSNKERGIYFQIAVPGTVDAAIDALRVETGLDLSGADLLYADAYAGLLTDVTSGVDLGSAWVNGVECEHLAFRAAKVDWQIWVRTGDQPLPMKYVITTKWMTGAPQYTVKFDEWNTRPTIQADRFAFKPAAGAKRLESLQANEMGEVEIQGAQR